MIICINCGRKFNDEGHLKLHKPHCKGKRVCQNPLCNNLLNHDQEKFCCSRCSGLVNSPGRKHTEETRRKISKSLGGRGSKLKLIKCYNCGKLTSTKKYCCLLCKIEYEYREKVSKWLSGEISGTGNNGYQGFVKKYFLEKFNRKCSKCGWEEVNPYTGLHPLHLHHIDGKWSNNRPENLELLCPNCHSLTENFGARNYKNGRPWMREYYKLKSHQGILL